MVNCWQDLYPIEEKPQRICVLRTDLAEAERMVCLLAEEEQQRHPEHFTGKKLCVYHKLSYVPAYENFQELRRLILQIHESTGMNAYFKGIIAVDISEWVGHEQEEYFTVFLKYIYDHQSFLRFLLIVNHCSKPQLRFFLQSCMRYVTPQLVDAPVFGNDGHLGEILRLMFQKKGVSIRNDASSLLADALRNDSLCHVRSLTLIERVVNDIVSEAARDKKIITTTQIVKYLSDSDTTLSMLLNFTLEDQRSDCHENEPLQL